LKDWVDIDELIDHYNLPTKGRNEYLTEKLFAQLNFVWAKLKVCLTKVIEIV